MIHRLLTDVLKASSLQKIYVILGPRQVGKTTMLEQLKQPNDSILMVDCDNYDDRLLLEDKTKTELNNLIDGYDVVMIDEAQKVTNIGLSLKMIGDLKSSARIYVTGSSSLQLTDEISEPATGRLLEYKMYPMSLTEMAQHTSKKEEQRLLQVRMIYGLYPEVVTNPKDARQLLLTIANNYLYKDILEYKGIKKPELLRKLLVALALQLGNEVSYNELSNMLGVDKETVENYIDLLEKCFVVFRLNSYSRNLRNEIKKGKKVYFYDNGIRNAIISNFAPLESRNDTGALWENLMVSERMKHNEYTGSYAQMFFWRTQKQKEIDLVEWKDGMLDTFEFKWKEGKTSRMPKDFASAYPNFTFKTITPSNFWEFV